MSSHKVCHVASIDITVKFLLMPQLQALKSKGYDVHVVCSNGPLIKDIENEGITVKTITITRKLFSPIADVIAFFKLYSYFKKEQFDVVHTHAPKPGLLGQLAAKFAGVPNIINTIHGLYFTEDSPYLKRIFFIFIEKISAKCSSLIFSQNKEDIQTMVVEKIAKPGNIKYLGNGIDVKKFDSKRFSQDFIDAKKKALGLSPDVTVIGTVGRLVREKGYLDLFEALNIVLKKHSNVVLLAIGPEEPQKRDAFKPAIVKEYGLEGKVLFLGKRNDLDELYPTMDIFVLPSWREGFPRSVLEAMAAERPIIATNIRGCREEIETGKNGILVPLKNPLKLAEAIIYILDNPSVAQSFSRNAGIKAASEFDEHLVFAKITQAYQELLEKKHMQSIFSSLVRGRKPNSSSSLSLENKNRAKKYLITGGAGFIGSHLVNILAERGNSVIVIDKLLHGNRTNVHPAVKSFKIDISDRKLFNIFKEEKPDIVYHLAGPIHLRKESGETFKKDETFLRDFKNVLAYAHHVGVKKVIFLSSGGAMYSGSTTIPTLETYQANPKSLYGLANMMMEQALQESDKQFGLNGIILRFSNVYGPGQWESGAIPSFIKSIYNDTSPVINGDGTQTRDFVYIDDAISALLLAAESQKTGIFNVGSGEEISLNGLFEKIATLMGKNSKPRYNFDTREETQRSALDCQKIKKELSWEPKTSLEEGLRKTIQWHGKSNNNKIKICHVTTVDITVKFFILNFLKHLKKEDYDVSIVCSPGKWSPLFKDQGFSVYNVTMLRRISPFADVVPLIKLFLYFKKEKFDIVHTYTPKAGVLGRIAARLAGVPIVVHTSFGFYVGIKIKPAVKNTILLAEKISAYFCDLVISQNKEDVGFAIKEKLVNAKKIKGINYGINVQLFNPLNFSQDFIVKKKEELHIAKDKKVIGMVGRFIKEKGYLDLLRAFKILKSKNHNTILLLVAPPDKEKSDALDYAVLKDYGIENDIILLGDKGEISNMEEIYSLMDIFVLPSFREGFPYSIMEASALAKPIVTTDIRGCREAVENGVTGKLIPVNDPKALANAVQYLLENPHRAKEMGDAGRKKAEKEFDENLAFDRIKKEYAQLIQEKL